MANKGYGYQYETSPRKLEPNYNKPNVKKKKTVQKKSQQTKKQNNKKTKNKSKKKSKMSFETKFFLNSMVIFVVVFAIIAFQALVEQRYKEKEGLKKKYNELIASSNVEADVNDDVRFLASEYGMQTKSATLVDLGTSDYIESSEDKIEIKEGNFFTNIIEWIKELF